MLKGCAFELLTQLDLSDSPTADENNLYITSVLKKGESFHFDQIVVILIFTLFSSTVTKHQKYRLNRIDSFCSPNSDFFSNCLNSFALILLALSKFLKILLKIEKMPRFKISYLHFLSAKSIFSLIQYL